MNKDIKNIEHAQELSVSELKILCKWRHGQNGPQKDSQKCKVLKDWLETKDDPAPTVKNWTTENEINLERIKTEKIHLNSFRGMGLYLGPLFLLLFSVKPY